VGPLRRECRRSGGPLWAIGPGHLF